MKLRRSIALVLVAVLSLAACQSSTLVSSLEAVIRAAEFALPVIAAEKQWPPEAQAKGIAYLQLVDAAIVQTSAILSDASIALKPEKVLALWASLVAGCNCLPAGTPSEIAAVLGSVGQAVSGFLENFLQGSMKRKTLAGLPVVVISRRDASALSKIRTRAEQNLSKLQGLKQ